LVNFIRFRSSYFVYNEHDESGENIVVRKVVHKQEQGQVKREKFSFIAAKQHSFETFLLILKDNNVRFRADLIKKPLYFH